jgi:hypothetical protein
MPDDPHLEIVITILGVDLEVESVRALEVQVETRRQRVPFSVDARGATPDATGEGG